MLNASDCRQLDDQGYLALPGLMSPDILTALRSRGDVRARGQSAGSVDADFDDLASAEVSTEDRVADADLTRRTAHALAELPDDARQVVVLRDVQGLSTKETAEVLGISQGAVKVRLHRAHARLRELVHV